MKKFIVKLGLKLNLQKMPYWMILLLILACMLGIYSLYNEVTHGTYQGCEDCSR